MILKKYKHSNLKNYKDIEFIYNQKDYIKKYLTKHDNITIMRNLDNFITFIIEELKIEDYEYRFILTCLFEYKYFKKALNKEIDIEVFKKIIVRRVIDTLKDASKESLLIDSLTIDSGLYIKNYKDKIDENFEIIKEMINKKNVKFNYCYLFDNIKYFRDDPQKKENYFRFISIIFYDYFDNKA